MRTKLIEIRSNRAMSESPHTHLDGPTRKSVLQADQHFDAARFTEAMAIVNTLAEAWLGRLRDGDEAAGEILRTVVAPRLDSIGSALASQYSLTEDNVLLEVAAQGLDRLSEVFGALGVPHFGITKQGHFALTCLRLGDWKRCVRILEDRILPSAISCEDLENEFGTRTNLASILEAHDRVGEGLDLLAAGIERALASGSALHVRECLELAHRVLSKHRQDDSPRGDWERFRRFAAMAGELELELQFRKLSGEGEEDSKKFLFERRKLFISYSRADAETVRHLTHLLRTPATEVCMDQESLVPGREWERDLSASIDAADVLVVLVGADTLNRPFVRQEIERFRRGQSPPDRPIIPVLLDGGTSTSEELNSYEWIDLRGDCAPERIVTRAGEVLRAVFECITGRVHEGTRGLSSRSPTADEGLTEKLKAGEFTVPPAALASMVNLGIVSTGQTCYWHGGPFEKSTCDKPVRYLCIGCGQGRCDANEHVSDGFLTLVASDNDRYQSLFAFCWCQACRAPVCSTCSQTEALKRRRISDLFLCRVPCPACRNPLQITPLFSDRGQYAVQAFASWVRCQGPPGPFSAVEPDVPRDSSLVDAVGGALFSVACGVQQTVFVAGDPGLLAYELESREKVSERHLDGPISALAVSAEYLVAGSATGKCHLFRRDGRDAAAVLEHHCGGSVTAVAVRQHEGSTQIIWGGARAMFSGFLLLSDLETGETRPLIEEPGRVLSLAMSPLGDMLAYTAFDEPIRLVDPDTGRRREPRLGHYSRSISRSWFLCVIITLFN